MNFVLVLTITAILSGAGISKETSSNVLPTLEEQMFDFGHMGIDYTVYCQFAFENRTDDTIRIQRAIANCDCGNVSSLDSIISPDDTAHFQLRFKTKDLFGPTNRSFTVITDHPDLDTLEFHYLSIVGQWFNGLRPEPAAIMFLPKKTTETVRIPNRSFDSISLLDIIQYDSSFTITATVDKAGKGSDLVLEITPRPDITKGTYMTNATLLIGTDEDSDPTILTIPIKIVRY
ncbi:MAG: DUF1573 domain-containing protein [candidate division Zixibacteria bacterium]|nr:DUF1573 domain-containing protein [candidate division Zixibacteria bacterium]